MLIFLTLLVWILIAAFTFEMTFSPRKFSKDTDAVVFLGYSIYAGITLGASYLLAFHAF